MDEAGVQYSCLEAYYQYQKAKAFEADQLAVKILWTYSPTYQRRLGESIPDFDAVKWARVAEDVMRHGLKLKFTQNVDLGERLVATGDAVLCEATDTEKVWSCGLALNVPNLVDKGSWPGASRLGYLLMSVRDELASDG